MLKINRKIFILLVTIIIAMSTYSFGSDSGIITGETVKLRDGASLEAKLVMLLSVNDKVEVLGQEGDWYNVKYQDKVGYVYKDYIKVTVTETTDENTQITDEPEQSQENKNNEENTSTDKIEISSEKIITEDTYLKILPIINSSDILSISKDTKVTVLEYRNGWVYLSYADGNGWIREEKLKDTTVEQANNNNNTENNTTPANDNNETQENNFQNETMYVNVNSVRVRKQATTSSEVVDSLILNNQVIVTGEEDDWYKVKVDGNEGYIAKQYLSDKQIEVTNRGTSVNRDESSTPDAKTPTENNNSDDKTTTGSDIVEYAKTFLGNKYVAGGSTPKEGFDCSGFTYYVYKHFGYTLNRASYAQKDNGVQVNKSDLQLGDLVLFTQNSSEIGHVGIYVGGNSFIHAANRKKGVIITSLSDSYYKARYVTARRIIK